jgi:hypothetical protein
LWERDWTDDTLNFRRPLLSTCYETERRQERHAVVFVLNLLSASFAVLAAAAWINSSMVKGYPTDTQEPRPPGLSYPTSQLGFGRDRKGRQCEFFSTIRLQSKWNAYAALLAFDTWRRRRAPPP